MNYRELKVFNSGGDKVCFYHPEDETKVIISFPQEQSYFLDWFMYLGVVSDWEIANDFYYVVVTRLEEVYDAELWKIRREENTVRSIRYSGLNHIEQIEKLYRIRGLLPTYRPVIEFLHDNPALNWYLDDIDFNYLKCPITGKIFPYDTIGFRWDDWS